MYHKFNDNKLRDDSQTEITSETLSKMYHGLCPFCPVPSNISRSSSSLTNPSQYRIISSSPKGDAELAWLKFTNLTPVDFSADSLQNIIPVCGDHEEMLLQGRIVLCLPICDLQKLLIWEKNDWSRRLREQYEDRAPSARVTPPVEELSGNLSCLWITSDPVLCNELADFSIECTWYSASEDTPHPAFPQHVHYLKEWQPPWTPRKQVSKRVVQWSAPCLDNLIAKDDRRADEPLPLFDMEFTFNRGQMRINPFATIVWALEMLGGAYSPPFLFYTEGTDTGSCTQQVPVGNPTEIYRKLLRELRDLYSRTDEDLQRERRVRAEVAEICAHAEWGPNCWHPEIHRIDDE